MDRLPGIRHHHFRKPHEGPPELDAGVGPEWIKLSQRMAQAFEHFRTHKEVPILATLAVIIAWTIYKI